MADPKRPRHLASTSKHKQLKDALVKINELQKLVDAVPNPDPSATFLALAQDIRDEMAVRALLMHSADMYLALRQLGFDTVDKTFAELRAMARQVFDVPGVHARLEKLRGDWREQKDDLLNRQVEIARFGKPEDSTRAFTTLAKVLGWQTTPDSVTNINRTVNVWQLYGGGGARGREMVEQPALPAEAGPLAFLAHEPGEPAKIDVTEDLDG